MTTDWREPELMQTQAQLPWYKRSFAAEVCVRCKYCDGLFKKKSKTLFRVIKIVPLLGLIFAVYFLAFENYKAVYVALLALWAILFIVELITSEYEKI